MKNNKKRKVVTFLDLNVAESQGIGKIIFKNALRLKNDALILSENDSFSTATSILILSLEEVIKAICVELHASEYQVYEIKYIDSVFYNHTKRHQLAETIGKIESLAILIKVIEYCYNKNQKSNFTPDNIDINIFNEKLRNLCDILNNICNDSPIEKFNTYKNSGIYVDYYNELLIPKDIITDYEFNQVNEVHNQITRIYKLIVLSHHQSIKFRNNSDAYLEIKKTIKEIIKTLKSENI